MKKVAKKEIKKLDERLAFAQRQLRSLGSSVIIVVEGWGASGKGKLINDMILPLDPRGFCVFTKSESDEEKRYPFLRSYMTKLPKHGEISIFDSSWYRKTLNKYIDKKILKSDFEKDIEEISNFEKIIADDGTLILKFFLDITKKEQKERLENLLSKTQTRWRVSDEDILNNQRYVSFKNVFKKMISKTDKAYSKWKIINANVTEIASYEIKKAVLSAMEEKIKEKNLSLDPKKPQIPEKADTDFLKKVDLSLDISKKDYKKELEFYQKKLFDLQNIFYLKKIPTVIVFEGWDAAGKGGAIKRLSGGLDPRGYRVFSTSAPTKEELSYHYLKRFWNNFPKSGHIAIFDRSWYGRVMVEPIEGFCNEDEYKRAFWEINETEKILYDNKTVIVKFFIHISKDEQLKRFEERKKNPEKAWKLTDEDYRNREKWDEYVCAIEKMLEKTSTSYAPWHTVSGNSKKYARIYVLKTVCEAMENYLKKEEKEL